MQVNFTDTSLTCRNSLLHEKKRETICSTVLMPNTPLYSQLLPILYTKSSEGGDEVAFHLFAMIVFHCYSSTSAMFLFWGGLGGAANEPIDSG